MNVAFFVIFLSSVAVLLVKAPESVLPALLSGGTQAGALCVSLLASYALWLGLMRVWEESGVTKAISKLLRPAVKRIFALEKNETVEATCMNLSANMLGIGAAATPYGIRAATLIEQEKNARFASAMLFVVNATSLQLIPTSVIAFRVSLESGAPADIILPTLISTVFSTLLGALLVNLFVKKETADKKSRMRVKEAQTAGAWSR